MPAVDFVQPLAQAENFACMNLDVRCLALEAAGRLMQHDAAVRQREALVLGAGAAEQRPHRRRLAHADGGYVRLDVLSSEERRVGDTWVSPSKARWSPSR